MTEHPILFSGAMVRAILDGRKTMTRRIVKPQKHPYGHWLSPDEVAREVIGMTDAIRCPHGRPGDTLWVRETWRPGAWREDGRVAVDYRASPEENRTSWLNVPPDKWEDLYLKLGDEALDALAAGRGSVRRTPDGDFAWDRGDSPCKWRPSIFMPRWASRITLRITDVRVERLQDITEGDARAEGAPCVDEASGREVLFPGACKAGSYRLAFRHLLWDSLNAKRGFGWDPNPLVWVVSFERVEAPDV